MTAVRMETAEDRTAIRQVHEVAFGQPDEADVVDRLRERAAWYAGLVATDANDDVLGHVAFSAMTMDPPRPDLVLAGLAPMAVLPEHQRTYVGTRLVEAGLDACRDAGCHAVFVLGHTSYYPRFGFAPAAPRGIVCEFDAPPEAFMMLELVPGSLTGVRGKAIYDLALTG